MAFEEQDRVDGWQVYSAWIDSLRNNSETIEIYDNDINFKEKLMSCKTNLEKFTLIWNNEKIQEEINTKYKSDLNRCQRKRELRIGKSIEHSKRMRELGNSAFKDGDFMKALNHYTQAIRFAPYPKTQSTSNQLLVADDSLALALANRSAALYALTRYRLCLSDIDLAIKYGYPKVNMFKLLTRKVRCLHVLSVWANDVEQIKDNLRQMLKSRDTKEFVKAEIASMFEFINQTQPEDIEKDELDVVDETTMKISNVSKSITQAADCIEMSYDCDKGRYLITNKDVSFGRLLIAEEPYVCNLAPSERDSYCYNCFERLHSCGIGCSKCTQVMFCSEECLNANFNVHKFECDSFLDFQEVLGVAYLISHIMFKINFDLTSIPVYSKKTVDKKSLDDALKIPLCDWPDLVYKNDYTSVLSLMDHSTDYNYDEIMGFSLTAAYFVIAFQDQFSDLNLKLAENQIQFTIGSILLKHLMQLQTNLISILDQNLQGLTMIGHSLSKLQERPIGVGIYPTVSLLNHSCGPNILSIFHRNRFVARAVRGLECGTEINYCYGPSVNGMTKKDRQKRLKQQYFFTCKCDSCLKSKENESRALPCPKCEGPIIYNQDFSHECMRCHESNVIDVKAFLEHIRRLEKHFEKLQASSISIEEKLKQLNDLEANLSKLAYWRNPMFLSIKSELIECAEGLGDIKTALRYCLEELDLCERTHGKESYESIMTKLKLINLNWQMLYYSIEESKTRESKEHKILELKGLISTINETRGKLRDLLASTNIIGAESSYETELKFLSDTQNAINRYLVDQDTPESEVAQGPT